jgi:hypothetical protein
MATVALSGSDTIIINARIISDLADGDVAVLDYPNNIAEVKTGKNGNSIYGLNETGKNAELTLRVIRGSADDKFLNSLLVAQEQNFAGTVLMIGEFIKKLGDGAGNIASDTYITSGGVFIKRVGAKSNVEGDTSQSVSEYKIKFSNAPRTIT